MSLGTNGGPTDSLRVLFMPNQFVNTHIPRADSIVCYLTHWELQCGHLVSTDYLMFPQTEEPSVQLLQECVAEVANLKQTLIKMADDLTRTLTAKLS